MADVVKYGIHIPNRVFVGGIAFDTKEDELKCFFQKYGKVRDCKIVFDKEGVSRGFGFVTFESKQEATQTQKLGTVFFNQKKLNLGPAIRQKGVVFNESNDVSNGGEMTTTSAALPTTGLHFHPSGYSYTVAPDGVWYFHGPGPTSPTDATVPLQLTRAIPPSPPAGYAADVSGRLFNGTANGTGTGHYLPSAVVQNGIPRPSHLTTHPSSPPIYTFIENVPCQPVPCFPMPTPLQQHTPSVYHSAPPGHVITVPLQHSEIYHSPIITSPTLPTIPMNAQRTYTIARPPDKEGRNSGMTTPVAFSPPTVAMATLPSVDSLCRRVPEQTLATTSEEICTT